MDDTARYLDSLKACLLEDEDGETLKLKTNPGLTEAALLDYEQSIGRRLPRQFRELMLCSNGMSLFGLSIMSKDELVWHHAQGLLAFHNWGNGDFDCIAVASPVFSCGRIVFMNHSPDAAVRVEGTLLTWLVRVVEEIGQRGALLHPMDYLEHRVPGVYQHVPDELAGIDYELNR